MMKDNQYRLYKIDLDSIASFYKEYFNSEVPSLDEIKASREIQARILFAFDKAPNEIYIENDGRLCLGWNRRE